MKSSINILALFIITLSCSSETENDQRTADNSVSSMTSETDSLGNSGRKPGGSGTSDEEGPNTSDKTPGTTTSFTWTKLAAGSQSRMDNRSMFVVNNKTKLDELWKIAFQQGMSPEKPVIDFTKNSVLILFLGQVNSGGHSIEPLSIRSSGDEPLYTITVRHNKPGTNCTTTSLIEYPYYFALTEKLKSNKQEFKVNEVEKKCE